MPILTTLGAACARAWGFTSGLLKDPYFNLTTLLLPGNGTNGAQNNTFLDGSSNNFTITRNGNTTQGTFSPFSQTGWGAVFGSSSTDMLTTASSAAFAFGAGDFTMEAFVYATANQTDNWIIGLHGNCWLRIGSAGKLEFYNNITTTGTLASTAMELNQWVHVAVVRSGTTLTIYKNGSSVAADPVSTNFSTSVACTIGNQSGADRRWNGYISNVRIVKGVAVYTGAFTPPTSPLAATQSAGTNISAITGTQTSLLICQSNRFRDASTNGFAVTANGSVAVTPFSPFAPTSSYSAAAVGGSGYFDGGLDYLTVPDNAAWDVGSSNFTIEGWFYPTGSPAQPILIGQWTSSYSWVMLLSNDSNRYIRGILYNGSGFSDYVSTAPLQLNAWNHCAFVRESNTVSLYLNGSRVLSNPFTGSVATSTSAVSLGANSSGADPYAGYMSSTRVVVGTALYSGTTYTVPTAPLTAVSGTQLLLNFTNAGVVDATAKNVLETESTAQISSSIAPKWGSTSIKFNGSSDYLRLAPQNLLNFGTGDFTIEAWVYTTDNTTLQAIFTTAADTVSTNNDWGVLLDIGASGAGTFRGSFYSGTTSYTASASSVVSNNTWTHVAFVRESGNIAVYYGTSGTGNRSSTTSANVAPNFSSSWTPKIGYAQSASTRFFNGYIQYLRISNRARYTGSTYTVPTAPFPVQ